MNRIAAAAIFGLAALLAAAPASAVTLDNGVVLITQADALAGGVTPGDTPGFPITLSVSGSYRFASSLLVNTAVDGIEVTAPEVTIDLAGFRMAGSGVGQTAVVAFQRALTVTNGTIRGFVVNAIYSSNGNLTVDNMRVVDNPIVPSTNAALFSAADYTTVRNSNISRNGGAGVACQKYCRVENSMVTGNVYIGVSFLNIGGILVGNTIASNNIGIGAFGITTFGDNAVIGNAQASVGTVVPLNPNQP